MIKPEFTSRVDLGHIIQAGILLLAATVGGGGVLGIYNAIESQISLLAVQQATLQQEGLQNASAIKQIQEDQRHLTDTINASLQKLGDGLSTLQVEVARSHR